MKRFVQSLAEYQDLADYQDAHAALMSAMAQHTGTRSGLARNRAAFEAFETHWREEARRRWSAAGFAHTITVPSAVDGLADVVTWLYEEPLLGEVRVTSGWSWNILQEFAYAGSGRWVAKDSLDDWEVTPDEQFTVHFSDAGDAVRFKLTFG